MTGFDLQQASREHFARIHRAALVLTGNPWDADDLAQETFLVLARQGHTFAARSRLSTWLYGVLLNLERHRRRQHGMARHKLRVLSEQSSDARQVPAAETPIEVREWKRSLWALVAQLPEGQRQSLVLRYSQRLSYDEIAAVLDCPLGTVKSRIHHGLAALRTMLGGQEDHAAGQIPTHVWEDLNHAV